MAYRASKSEGIGLVGLYALVGGVIIAAVASSKANAAKRNSGRFSKDGQFYYFQVSENTNPANPAAYAVQVSDAFAEIPPSDRDGAIAMQDAYYTQTAEDGQAYIEGYADEVLA
jgi:hypothetical protein